MDLYKYLQVVLEKFEIDDAKPLGTPVSTGTQLVSGEAHELLAEKEKKQYMSIVGSLVYAMLGTRLDIAYVVSLLSQHLSKPTDSQDIDAVREGDYGDEIRVWSSDQDW